MPLKCCAEECTRNATHRIFWQLADIQIPVCVDHLNLFINAPMSVTDDLDKPWREEDPLQASFNALAGQAREALARGEEKEAGLLVGKAMGVKTMAKEQGKELDDSDIRPVEEALFKFPAREKEGDDGKEEGQQEEA